MLTIIEIAGTILLIVGVFRRLSPLLLNLLALGVGIAVAFAGTFLIFGEIHVAALLFGTSLIGVAVDYGLHYCTTAFGTAAVTGRQRLAFVMPAITPRPRHHPDRLRGAGHRAVSRPASRSRCSPSSAWSARSPR